MEETILVVAYYGTERWWRSVMEGYDNAKTIVVTEQKTGSDYPISQWYNEAITNGSVETSRWTDDEITDIILRCRVLRWLPQQKAISMIYAMTHAYDRLYDKVEPNYILSLPIDRFSKDIAIRLAERRGISNYELTVSPLPGRCMLMKRGELVCLNQNVQEADVEYFREVISSEFYKPYYAVESRSGVAGWMASFSYQLFRASVFRLKSIVEADPNNVHYLDSSRALGHKAKMSDIILLGKITSPEGIDKIVEKGRYVFIPLQLFPEASLDYWIEDNRLHDQERVLGEVVGIAKAKGLDVIIKDHPLQLGFRKFNQLSDILSQKDVYFAPYSYNSNILARGAVVLFTLTGTLGWQSAICGGKVICCQNYYSHPDHMAVFSSYEQMHETLEQHLNEDITTSSVVDHDELIRLQLADSFEGEFGSLSRYPSRGDKQDMLALGRRLNSLIDEL